MDVLPRTRGCFGCGRENPSGLHLELVAPDRHRVETRFQFRAEHCGFRATVHGGLIATALDEVMVWAIGVATRQLSYCGEFTVRFLRPTAPDVTVIAVGELEQDRRGRLFLARAELRDAAGQTLAEGSGKYLPIPGELRAGMWEDFLDDPTPVFGPRPESKPPAGEVPPTGG